MSTDIIITNYNYAHFLMDCIHSCEMQRGVKIILVDDASTDNSRELLKEKIICYDDFQSHFLDENEGVSHARNEGLKESTSEFIQILDADDMLVEGSIELRRKYLEDHPELDLVYGSTLELKDGKIKPHKSELATHSILFRRRVFEKFGLFYEPLRTKEDKEFKYRIGLHRQSFNKGLVKYKKINKPVAIYRRHDGAKRKKRSQDINLEIETQMIFDSRVKQLEREGITKENTRML